MPATLCACSCKALNFPLWGLPSRWNGHALVFQTLTIFVGWFAYTDFQAKSQITSTSDSPSSRTSDTHSQQGLQTSRDASVLSFAEAQRLISLFFALCKKVCSWISQSSFRKVFPLFWEKYCDFFQKPSLLRLVFEVYGKAPKTVIQVS